MQSRPKLVVASALVWTTASLGLVACGGSTGSGFGGGDAGTDATAARSPDARSNATPDATPDGSAQTHAEAGTDGAIHATDSGSDAPGDAGRRDTAAPVDAGHDSAAEPIDAGHEAASPTDAGHDVAVGPGDAGHDVAEIPDAGVDTAPPQPAVVYGQSAKVLYAVDPNTHAVTEVGAFTGCGGSVIDIALDRDSNMYATTFDGVYAVDRTTAACTTIALGTYPNSLSFVPAGTVDPSEEALVGYVNRTYVRIDTTSGAITTIGSLGATYTSSGDIVSVIGGETYLTVTGGSDCSANDCLVQVNPTTGALIMNYGSVQHAQVFGLAFWGGNVYGFDSAGALFEVTFPGTGGIAVTGIPIPDAPSGLSFFGAGSTTSAPKN